MVSNWHGQQTHRGLGRTYDWEGSDEERRQPKLTDEGQGPVVTVAPGAPTAWMEGQYRTQRKSEQKKVVGDARVARD